MKQGKVTLFSLGTTYLGMGEIATALGPKVWVKTELTNGVALFDPAGGSFKLATLPHNVSGGLLVAAGRVWSGCLGAQPGVYNRPVTSPPSPPFTQVAKYELGWIVMDLASGGDGSVWAAVSKNPSGATTESGKGGIGGPAEAARLDRLLLRPTGRGLGKKAVVKLSIDLPAGWNPLYVTAFQQQPDLLYLVACTAPQTYVAARVSVKTHAVQTLFQLPGTQITHAPLAGSDGTLWVYGTTPHSKGAGSGWLVHADTAGRTVSPQHYSDPARAFEGLGEGVDQRMFLMRSWDDPATHKRWADILLFKFNPAGGSYGPVAKIGPPKQAWGLVADRYGSFWFKTIEHVSDTVTSRGLGRFVPPDVDPLNPDG